MDAYERLLFIYGLLADAVNPINDDELKAALGRQGQAIHELIGLLVDLKLLPHT